jgi:uncharacterized membrane protein
MYLVNLTLLELLSVFGVASAVVVALYLLDRSRRKLIVPTLRFWEAAEKPAEARRRKQIQQPLSLLLQLAGIALLAAAVGQLRWGASPSTGRDHVLILDTSAWMAARSGVRTALDEARTALGGYLRTLPANDRVMLIRADALATPATGFESSRDAVDAALRASAAGATALNLDRALAFARRALEAQGRRKGEIVYAGAGRVGPREAGGPNAAANLRVLPVGGDISNCGFEKFGLRRSHTDPGVWEIHLSVRNYNAAPRTVTAVLQFAGAPAGTRRLDLQPGAEGGAIFEYRTRAAGWLEARLLPEDDLAADNRAVIEIPAQTSLKVVVYSARPELLRPVLSATAGVEAVWRNPRDYQPKPEAGVMVIDGFRPPSPPAIDAIWIDPAAGASPVPVRRVARDTKIVRWATSHALGEGLHAQGSTIALTQVFEPAPSDIQIAETEFGPAILARPGAPRTIVFGFHPLTGAPRYELTTPLVFANILRWLSPETFRRWELSGASAGSVETTLGPEAAAGTVRVVSDTLGDLPFSIDGNRLRFFAGAPGNVRVLGGGRELVYSLTLPELGAARWEAPPGTAYGVPRRGSSVPLARELWRWLAVAGAAVLVYEWWRYGARRSAWRRWPATNRGRAALILKAAMVAAVLVALFEPAMTVFETKVAVVALVDTSASVSGEDLQRASDLADRMEQARGRNWLRVVPFARATRPADAAEHATRWNLRVSPGEPGRATDIETAVREAAALLPAGLVPRLVLISDGLENRGSVARASWQAGQLGIPIDTFALAGRPKPELHLESASIPSTAFSGERFPVDLRVISPRSASAVVEIAAGGKVLGSVAAKLTAGVNEIRANSMVAVGGAVDLSGAVRAEGLGEVRFAQAVNLRRPRVLWISEDPPGSEVHLLKTFEAGRFEVARPGDWKREKWESFELLVFNNWDIESLTPAEKKRLESYVKQGGGVLVIGGERNLHAGKKGQEDPLDRLLPAKIAPPRSPEGTCVVLIVDKSSSMEGKKMELARLAAIGVVQNLRPIDSVGVLMFDNSFQWVVPIRRAEDRSLIVRLISGITPDGGTQIAPALAEAYRKVLPVKATFKHVVLLTDGISEEGDSMTLARDAEAHRVTISTVGLGQDVNRAYLEKVAGFAKGKAYFLTDPAGLEQILLRDVMEHTGSTVVEKLFRPMAAGKTEILDGVNLEQAPELKGYVRYVAKPTAETILSVDRKDPLLVRWQYGLGRVAVFTSDAKSRWAADWVGWPGFDKFWTNLTRDLLPHARAGESAATIDGANDELVVDYRLSRYVEEPSKIPGIFVSGPDGFMQPVPVSKLAQGAYRGRVPIGKRQGLFRVRPLEESRAFPEAGVLRQEKEIGEYGSNPALLENVARFTGGRVNPDPREVFEAGGRALASSLRLWPALLALAVLCNLGELALRKLRGSATSPATT